MNKEQASKAYIKGKLRDHQEYLGCEEKRRKRLITCDLYDLEQAFEDGWDASVRNCCIGRFKQAGGYIWRFATEVTFENSPQEVELKLVEQI